MPTDDRFRKVQEAGADFIETARARAEELLRELSRAGENTSDRAQGTLDEVVEGGRRGAEQLVSIIRKEISTQLSLLGLATKQDLADLERRLTSKATGTKATGTKSTGSKAAGPKASAASGSTKAAKKSETGKAAAKPAPAKKTAG